MWLFKLKKYSFQRKIIFKNVSHDKFVNGQNYKNGEIIKIHFFGRTTLGIREGTPLTRTSIILHATGFP